MGLDSIIKVFDDKTNEYTSHLSKEIADKFEPIKHELVGFNVHKYDDHYFIAFSGKAYSYVVNIITNGKYGLYQDLEPKTLKLMYDKFKNFLSEFEYDYEPAKDLLENIDKLYETNFNVENWFYALTNHYIPSPREIKCLMEIFNLCAENNLMIHASY